MDGATRPTVGSTEVTSVGSCPLWNLTGARLERCRLGTGSVAPSRSRCEAPAAPAAAGRERVHASPAPGGTPRLHLVRQDGGRRPAAPGVGWGGGPAGGCRRRARPTRRSAGERLLRGHRDHSQPDHQATRRPRSPSRIWRGQIRARHVVVPLRTRGHRPCLHAGRRSGNPRALLSVGAGHVLCSLVLGTKPGPLPERRLRRWGGGSRRRAPGMEGVASAPAGSGAPPSLGARRRRRSERRHEFELLVARARRRDQRERG